MKRSDHRGKESPKIKLRPEPVIRPNMRDRSEQAEEKRAKFSVMNFLGFAGLLRSLVNWGAKQDSAKPQLPPREPEPFRHYFADQPDKMRAAFVRHIHPRRKRNDKAYCNAKYEAYLATLPK